MVVGFLEEKEEGVDSLSAWIPSASAQEVSSTVDVSSSLLLVLGIFVSLLLLIVVAYVFSLYVLIVLYDEHTGWKSTLRKALALILPFLWLSIWIFIRSFIWIPLAILLGGPIILSLLGATGVVSILLFFAVVAILFLFFYHLPRLQFGQVLLIKEGKKARQCVEESFLRTQGYWGKIVGNQLLLGICIMVCFLGFSFASVLLFATLGSAFQGLVFIAFPVLFIFAIGVQYLQYVALAFQYELAQTIFAHTRSS